ncbi:GNAT family N-acetyltransferase [Streptomyces sp. TP-A0874]|uniref:GNAT family N-acetyltransferase n=1 Tax=Streptomyces sp. TP-A0874 TaxID=549819 RepID=UPI000852AC41|nr:GNAT family N-acetyltransferase [Streptomyces sp. TP-A0874]
MTESTAPVVERFQDKCRYEIRSGEELAGFTAYRDHDGQRIFYHTEIDDTYTGQGLASRLVQQALTDTRESGKRIVPVCPYVAKFLRRHVEFDENVDPVTADVRRWLNCALHDRAGN